jgi:excisionase family DNA binding protein
MMIDTNEAARRLGLSRMRVVQLLNEGRIPNASKFGGQRGIWVIEVEGDAAPKVLGGNRRRKRL